MTLEELIGQRLVVGFTGQEATDELSFLADSQLTLSRAMLPKATEVFVLTHPRAAAFGD